MSDSPFPLLRRVDSGAEYPLRGRIVTIGSARECSIRIDHAGLPARVAHAVFGQGLYTLQPLQKQVLVSVNGETLTDAHGLRHDDRVRIGSLEFIFMAHEPGGGRDSGPEISPRNRQIGELIGIVVGLLRNRDHAVYDDLVSSVARLLGSDAARLVVENGESRQTIARFPLHAGLDRFSTRAIDWARQASSAVLMQEADWQDEAQSQASLEKNFVSSVICAPLKDGQRLLGYLYLDRMRNGAAFGEDDRALCDLLAPLFAQILVNDEQRRRQAETIERLQSGALASEGGIICESPRMKELLSQAQTFAATDSPVLVLGETGTGKELLARFIHQRSDRAGRPFRAINCGAIPENIMESELFGHEKGAFTGASQRKIGLIEAADGGTVFLDEIGEMPLPLQVKLLRFLQESEIMRVGGTEPVRVDIRVVAATNRTLEEEVAEGRFRQDLYFRLNVLSLKLPPLRERDGDVVVLAEYLVAKYCERFGLQRKSLSPSAIAALRAYGWPGNIRELENIIQRTVLMAPKEQLDGGDISFPVSVASVEDGPERLAEAVSLKAAREEAERRAIVATLSRCTGNVSQAAKELQIDRKWLMKKMAELGVAADSYRE